MYSHTACFTSLRAPHSQESFFEGHYVLVCKPARGRGRQAGRRVKDASQDLRCSFGPSKSELRPKINLASQVTQRKPPSRLDTATATATCTLVATDPSTPLQCMQLVFVADSSNCIPKLHSRVPAHQPKQTRTPQTSLSTSRQDVADELSILR